MNFKKLLKLNQKELKKHLVSFLKSCKYTCIKNEDGFLYAEGTIPVLLVAHLDTVHEDRIKCICYSGNGDILMSPQGIGGDDRCGVYAIMKTIAQHKCHVLFCENEEIGCLGAIKFTESKIKPKVNYIVELDRHSSNDAVYYDCENKEFEAFITTFGFVTQTGSFTDISKIAPYLGVAAVNLSSAYYNAHTKHEYIVMSELLINIERLKKIVMQSNIFYKYEERRHIFNKYRGIGYDDDLFAKYKFTRLNHLTTDADMKSGISAFEPSKITREVRANNIFDNNGYVITNGIIRDDFNYYIGEDGRVYSCFFDGLSIHMPNAEAYNNDGTQMSFTSRRFEYILDVIKNNLNKAL